MGTFKIEITAVGGHGCQRDIKDGELVPICEDTNCPDCMGRKLVQEMIDKGVNVEKAKLIHWPDTDETVKDDLLSGLRKGNF